MARKRKSTEQIIAALSEAETSEIIQTELGIGYRLLATGDYR